MIELYPQIKTMHVAAAIASGALFLLRGLVLQAGERGRWAMASPLRYLSYGIDTVLLAAALMLLAILPAAVYGNGWLAAKLLLLVAYVGLGTFALKRGRTRQTRLACFVGALAVYGSMLAVARTHDPLGPFRVLLG